VCGRVKKSCCAAVLSGSRGKMREGGQKVLRPFCGYTVKEHYGMATLSGSRVANASADGTVLQVCDKCACGP